MEFIKLKISEKETHFINKSQIVGIFHEPQSWEWTEGRWFYYLRFTSGYHIEIPDSKIENVLQQLGLTNV
jgi:hypothetical protein